MGFRDFLNEVDSKIKIKKEQLFDLPAKQYSTTIPLCRKINADIKKVCDLIEHDGYYVLYNKKSYKTDLIISPENLSKITGAAEAVKNKSTLKIGVSEYEIYERYSICNKVQEVIVTGDIISEIPKNTGNNKFFDSQLIYGLNLSAMTENIASASAKDGKFGGYFNDDVTSLKIHGSEGTIDTSKPFVTWAQQHATYPFTMWNANQVKWATVSMNTMFPRAYAKSNINKKDVFVIK